MTNENRFVPQEVTQLKDPVKITAESLYADNKSAIAQQNITIWHENAQAGRLIQTNSCDDSRQVIPGLPESVHVQTIGTGGSKEAYKGLTTNRAVRAVVNAAHHAGNTVAPRIVPKGCGGLGAKEDMQKSGQRGHTEGIGHYIENDIYHSDVTVQSCVSAFELSDMSDKPVLAATQDHLTGFIYPLVGFWTKGNTRYNIHNRSITLEDLLRPEKYNPAKIYQDGLPIIDEYDLPDVFLEYLEANKKEVTELHEKYPDFRQRQETQNPTTVVLSTDIRPLRLRFPENFDTPGSVFRGSLPRRKYVNGAEIAVEIPERDLVRAVNQLQYPIEHFSNVENLIIDTRNYQFSLDLMGSFMTKPWMRDWREIGGKQVILIESQGGRVSRIGDVIL